MNSPRAPAVLDVQRSTLPNTTSSKCVVSKKCKLLHKFSFAVAVGSDTFVSFTAIAFGFAPPYPYRFQNVRIRRDEPKCNLLHGVHGNAFITRAKRAWQWRARINDGGHSLDTKRDLLFKLALVVASWLDFAHFSYPIQSDAFAQRYGLVNLIRVADQSHGLVALVAVSLFPIVRLRKVLEGKRACADTSRWRQN